LEKCSGVELIKREKVKKRTKLEFFGCIKDLVVKRLKRRNFGSEKASFDCST
jgi:hypothetical protein